MLQRVWHSLGDPKFGLMNTLSDGIARCEDLQPGLIPDLRKSRALIVASDYGGHHQESRFESYSFLIIDGVQWAQWETARTRVRHTYRLGKRRFAFKGMGDRRKARALPAFLSAADMLHGLCATILVEKSLQSLFREHGRLQLSDTHLQAFAHYDARTFERLLRTVHLLSFLLGGLSGPGQDALWITDQDEIAANPERLTELTRIFADVSGHYLPHDLGHLRCATAASDNGTLEMEDLLSIADLTAGALAEMATAYAGQGGFPKTVIAPHPVGLSRKARQIIEWFSVLGMPLSRTAHAIRPGGRSPGLVISHFRFHWGRPLSGTSPS